MRTSRIGTPPTGIPWTLAVWAFLWLAAGCGAHQATRRPEIATVKAHSTAPCMHDGVYLLGECLCIPSYAGKNCETSDAALCNVDAIGRGALDPSALKPAELCDVGTAAAATGNTRVLAAALSSGFDVNCTSSYDIRPLHAAASGGNVEIVSALIARGAQPDSLSGEKHARTPIMWAAAYGRLAVIDKLVELDPDPCRFISAFSVVSYAVMSGRRELVSHVLPICAVGKTAPGQYSQALFVAASAGYSDILLDLMSALPKGSDLAKLGAGALLVSVMKGHDDIVEMLIERGVPVSVHARDGETLLMVAAAVDRAEMIKLLLRRGADPNTYDDRGGSALDFAVVTGSTKALEVLLASGVDINGHKTPCGNTALHFAVMYHQPEVVLALLQHGAAPDVLNCDERDALSIAKDNGFSDIEGILQREKK